MHIRYFIYFKNLDLKSVSHVEMTDETLLYAGLKFIWVCFNSVITDSNTHMNYTVDWKLNTWLSQTRPDSTRPDQTQRDQTRPDSTRPDQTPIRRIIHEIKCLNAPPRDLRRPPASAQGLQTIPWAFITDTRIYIFIWSVKLFLLQRHLVKWVYLSSLDIRKNSSLLCVFVELWGFVQQYRLQWNCTVNIVTCI